tara:strand:+ start:436 stop:702 length:267 start_codon:yes stop_codon:yes gene_type:complete
MSKAKIMLFKCKGVGVPNDLPICTNTITTTLDDKRIETRGGYAYELFGKKMFMPTTRTYRCKDCLDYIQQWEDKVLTDLHRLYEEVGL